MEVALILDAKNDNSFWANAVSKEMGNVRVAFKIQPDGTNGTKGSQGPSVCAISLFFNIKREDIRCKNQLLA